MLCYAHTLHLVFEDIKKDEFLSNDDVPGSSNNDVPTFMQSIDSLLRKVRVAVKHFKSGNLRDKLRKYQAEHGMQQLMPIIDVKTRWNSSYKMARRFLEIDLSMKAIVSSERRAWPVSDSERVLLEHIIGPLSLFDDTTKYLSRRGISLAEGDRYITNLVVELGRYVEDTQSVFAIRMLHYLKMRLCSRRTPHHTVARFLSDPYGFEILENILEDFATKENLESFKKTTYQIIEDHLVKFANISAATIESNVPFLHPINFAEQARRIKAGIPTAPPLSSDTIQEKVRREIAALKDSVRYENGLQEFWEKANNLAPHLVGAYNRYKVIRPTSTDAERAFSNTGQLVSPARQMLLDTHVDKMSFMRSYFQNNPE